MAQTFNDLWQEHQRTNTPLVGFVVWMFLDTAIGMVREHLMRMALGARMNALLKTLGAAALLWVLLILPFMMMEVVSRRRFHEAFPVMLFFVMWLNVFAISSILLPILCGRRHATRDRGHPVATSHNARRTTPRSAAIMSVAVLLAP